EFSADLDKFPFFRIAQGARGRIVDVCQFRGDVHVVLDEPAPGLAARLFDGRLGTLVRLGAEQAARALRVLPDQMREPPENPPELPKGAPSPCDCCDETALI